MTTTLVLIALASLGAALLIDRHERRLYHDRRSHPRRASEQRLRREIDRHK